MANADDIILIAGKGHEAYQIFAHKTIEFDDAKVAYQLCQRESEAVKKREEFLPSFAISFLTSCAAPVYREITPLPPPTPSLLRLPSHEKSPVAPQPVLSNKGGPDRCRTWRRGLRRPLYATPRYQEKNLTHLHIKTAQDLSGADGLCRHPHPLQRCLRCAWKNAPKSPISSSLKLFVSVHYNSAPSTEAEGIEVYYYRKPRRSNPHQSLPQTGPSHSQGGHLQYRSQIARRQTWQLSRDPRNQSCPPS